MVNVFVLMVFLSIVIVFFTLYPIKDNKKNWETVEVDDYHVHVMPRNDTIIHDYNDHCSCGVVIEPVKRKDGSIGWLITHYAQDGREN